MAEDCYDSAEMFVECFSASITHEIPLKHWINLRPTSSCTFSFATFSTPGEIAIKAPSLSRSSSFGNVTVPRPAKRHLSKTRKANDGKPGFVAFTAVNFRDTAIAYGRNRDTMKKHSICKEALAVADAVFIRVQSRAAAKAPSGRHRIGEKKQRK